MFNALKQYFKDTQNEMHHVAWPTRNQTILYTGVVVAFSLFVSLYLGLFDFIFTSTLTRAVNAMPASNAVQIQKIPVNAAPTETTTKSPVQVQGAETDKGSLTLPNLGDKKATQ